MTALEHDAAMVSKKRAAELLDVGLDFITARIADGSLPAKKLGHRTVRIHLRDLQAFTDASNDWHDQQPHRKGQNQ